MSEPTRRREFLKVAACGFGQLALAGLAAEQAAAASRDPLAPRAPHFRARAKRIIFLFMQGGVSQVDSFDYKPHLERYETRRSRSTIRAPIANTRMRGSSQRVLRSPWTFARHGECGRWGSELFPEINRHIDDLCFIHSMHTEGVAHGPATLFLHCGATTTVRPSMGSWVQYGLGTENANLPGFVSIGPSAGNGGARNYGNAFLPAVYQGTALGKAGGPAAEATIRNLSNPGLSKLEGRRRFNLVGALNAEQLRRDPGDSELEAVIASYELAWRMQSQAPEVLDLSGRLREDYNPSTGSAGQGRQPRPAVPAGRPRPLRAGLSATCRSPTATAPPTPRSTSIRTCRSTPPTPGPSTGRSPGSWPT